MSRTERFFSVDNDPRIPGTVRTSVALHVLGEHCVRQSLLPFPSEEKGVRSTSGRVADVGHPQCRRRLADVPALPWSCLGPGFLPLPPLYIPPGTGGPANGDISHALDGPLLLT